MEEPRMPATMMGRTFDWRPRFDERSKAFRYGAATLPSRSRLCAPGPDVLNQGQEGACVGHACAGEAAASPVRVKGVTNEFAFSLYRRAQRLDDWPGEAYSGTSVLAGCLAGREQGLWAGFRWAMSAEEYAAAIVDLGPGVAGVEWREGSYDTDPNGVLRPSGAVVGGHAICVLGYLTPDHVTDYMRRRLMQYDLWKGFQSLGGPAFCGLNSWGPSFGKRGLFLIPLDVMRGWVKAGGEFALPTGRGRRIKP
jgi:hypothetical protein